jgi:hypothetical protein
MKLHCCLVERGYFDDTNNWVRTSEPIKCGTYADTADEVVKKIGSMFKDPMNVVQVRVTYLEVKPNQGYGE